MKKLVLLGIIALGIGFGSPAQSATYITGDFTIANGSPSVSGGTVTFTLNPDGTISAVLTSTMAAILGFGFDSNPSLPESGFSPNGPENTGAWGDMYGYQASGFYCGGCGTTEMWTIGTLGQFSDVFQALTGGGSQYDFFLLDRTGVQWAANAEIVDTAVPEPASWAMMLLGFGAVGFVMRRRRLSTNGRLQSA